MSLVIGAGLYSQDDIFLGDLVPAARSANSVCDATGPYGSDMSETSIRNPYGPYGSVGGDESAFNPNATSPPLVKLDGEELGVLTVSPFVIDAIDPDGLLQALGCP